MCTLNVYWMCTQTHMCTPQSPSEEYMMPNCEANYMTVIIAWERFIRRITALTASLQQPNVCPVKV